jgi:hypothetical protein
VEITDPPPGVTIAWPTSPDLAPLKASSSSTRRGKGGVVESTSEGRSFRPLRAGSLEFPPVTVTSPLGTTLSTASMKLSVIQGHVAGATRASRERRKASEPVVPPDSKEFFLHAETWPPAPTLGDVVEVRLTLLVRAGSKARFLEDLELAWADVALEDLAPEVHPEDRVIDGVTYRQFELRALRGLPRSVGPHALEVSAVMKIPGDSEATKHPLRLAVPLVVPPADDARRAFTNEEAEALLVRKRTVLERLRAQRRAPVSPMRSLTF